jgi:hypothetical protein
MTITTTVTEAPVRERRRYQREVEQLLDQVRRQMTELRRLKAAGAVGKALADRKQRLEQTRRQLASLTSASSAV